MHRFISFCTQIGGTPIRHLPNPREILSFANFKSLVRNNIVKKYGIFQIGNVISAILGFVLYTVMARFISASDIGVYSLYFYTLSLLFSVFSLSLHNVLTILTPRYLAENKRLVPKLVPGNYSLVIILSIVALVLLFCFRSYFYNLLNVEATKLPFVVFGIFPFLALFSLNDHPVVSRRKKTYLRRRT